MGKVLPFVRPVVKVTGLTKKQEVMLDLTRRIERCNLDLRDFKAIFDRSPERRDEMRKLMRATCLVIDQCETLYREIRDGANV